MRAEPPPAGEPFPVEEARAGLLLARRWAGAVVPRLRLAGVDAGPLLDEVRPGGGEGEGDDGVEDEEDGCAVTGPAISGFTGWPPPPEGWWAAWGGGVAG